ncbi:receptor like protein 7 [Artemisia annua]|uniref:Receptor like protein 7 n=1 Tax=Artemisia annua TaxID=35608 RepID=A0A2U1P171_ARTAN|nr:receptor like protein 7 [Artemisia annua]
MPQIVAHEEVSLVATRVRFSKYKLKPFLERDKRVSVSALKVAKVSNFISIIWVDTILVSGQCQINHQMILIHFKNELQFDSSLSRKLVTWNPNATDCCSWGGVTCSINGQVIGLDLSNEMISGGINDSSVLFGVKNLESLNLAENNFNFTKIPTRFGSLASLLYLNLSYSRFSGQIPEQLSQLTRLEVLDLSSRFPYGIHLLKLENPSLATLVRNLTRLRGLYMDNVNMSDSYKIWKFSKFSGQIPEQLSQLTRLEVLDLSSRFPYGIHLLKLENPSLATLVRNLTRLRGLYMDNVNMSSHKLDWSQGLSSSLPNLEVLSLFNCQLSGPLDESLQKLQSLSVLRLNYNGLNAPIPDFFANFKNLTILNLVDCNLIGTFPKNVLQLQKLQSLDLSINRNLNGSLPEFPVNRALQSLVISGTNFYGGIPESIGNLKNLYQIELHTNNFSGGIPKSMENLTQLSYLDLSSNKFIGKIPSFKPCKNLTHIDLSRNGLSGIIPSDHFQDLHNLVKVNLRINGFNGSVPSSLFSLPNVKQIDLSNNNFDGLLPNSSIPLLEWLDLSSNNLKGEIPRSFFELGQLSVLLLSSNNLSGVIG